MAIHAAVSTWRGKDVLAAGGPLQICGMENIINGRPVGVSSKSLLSCCDLDLENLCSLVYGDGAGTEAFFSVTAMQASFPRMAVGFSQAYASSSSAVLAVAASTATGIGCSQQRRSQRQSRVTGVCNMMMAKCFPLAFSKSCTSRLPAYTFTSSVDGISCMI